MPSILKFALLVLRGKKEARNGNRMNEGCLANGKQFILGWDSGRSGIKGIEVRARAIILERATFGAREVPEMRPADSTAH